MKASLPSAADFPAVDPSSQDWATIEAILAVELETKWRGRIKDALNHCVAGTFFAVEDAAKAKSLGVVRVDGTAKQSERVLEFIRVMDKLVDRWARLPPAFKDSMVKYDVAVPAGHRSISGMVADAAFHQVALTQWMRGGVGCEPDPELWEIATNLSRSGLTKEERAEQYQRHADLMAARRIHPKTPEQRVAIKRALSPYDRMIRQAAGIYRGVKGHEPTTGLTVSMLGERVSEFIRFVQALDSLLPEPVRRSGADTPGAWDAAVRRALAKHDKRGGN